MNIPAVIIQGDTVTWRDVPTADSLGNSISSPDWTLTWYFAGHNPGLTVVSTAYSGGWQTTLTSVQTAALVVTTTSHHPYSWQARASHAGQNVTIGTGMLHVDQSIATASNNYDGRTQTEKDLAAVQAEIRARITGGMTIEYEIGSRKLKKEPMTALLELESRLKAIVSKERQAQSIANGLGDPRNTYVRFT